LGGTIPLEKQPARIGGHIPAVRGGGGRAATALTPGAAINVTYQAIDGGQAILSMKKPYPAEWRADAASVEGKPGDTLRFMVIKDDKDGVSLRQIFAEKGRGAGARAQIQGRAVVEMLRSHRLVSGGEAPERRADMELKKARALAKIRRELAYAGDRASVSAVKELLASGINLEKISLPLLNSALAEIEGAPREQAFNDIAGQPGELVADSLARHGLPLSMRNVKALESVRAKLPERLEDAQIAAVIRSGKPLTVETVFMEQFSNGGRAAAGGQPDGDIWEEIKGSVEAAFARDGIENSEENRQTSRFLLKNDLPVNGGNIDKYKFLKNIKDNAEIGPILGRAARKIKDGASPLAASLTEAEDAADGARAADLRAEYEAITAALPRMSAAHIDLLAERGLPVSLANLRSAALDGQARIEAVAPPPGSHVPPDLPGVPEIQPASIFQAPNGTSPPPEIRLLPDAPASFHEHAAAETLTAKRQLAEIQLRFTRQAAHRLMGKNISIDTMPLEAALEELRLAEREAYAANLRAAGAADSADNVSAMAELYTKLGEARPLSNGVFADIIRKTADFTLNGVHRSVTAARYAVLAALEANATAPDPRFGDSFRLVKGQFSGFLANMGLEPADANVRAAAILSRNGMDIDEASLLEVKTIDAKISAVADSLHPRIAAFMIKDGKNPLEMSLDEVLEYIAAFENQYGNNLGDKIAAALAEMDRKSEMEPGLREAVVAIYRALGVIGKNEGAALGSALKSGARFTLGNLMDASKYFQRTNARTGDKDILIGANFGEREKTEAPEGNIRKTLEERRAEYGALVYRDFAGKAAADAEAFSGMIREKTGWLDAPLEQLTRELPGVAPDRVSGRGVWAAPADDFAASAGNAISGGHAAGLGDFAGNEAHVSEYAAERALAQLRSISEIPPGLAQWMEQNGIPVSLQNAAAAQSLAANPFFAEEGLNGLDEGTRSEIEENILDTELSQLKSGREPEEMLNGLERGLEKSEFARGSRLEELKLIQNAIKVRKYTARPNSFQLPVRLSGGVGGLNMYVINEEALKEGGARVYISLKTKGLGAVQAYFTARGGAADVDFTAERPEAARYLREKQDALAEGLAAAGYAAGKLNFGEDSGNKTNTWTRI